MSKGLDALETLGLYELTDVKQFVKDYCREEYEIIEQELERGDMAIKSLKYIFNLSPNDSFDDIDEKLQEHYNKLKALEIINNKNVDVDWFKRTNDSYSYNQGILMSGGSCGALTKEEYELLKEILS